MIRSKKIPPHSLPRQGLTMPIITHEKKLAQDVSSRVFYIEHGVI